MNTKLKKLVISSFMLAATLYLPFLTGQIPQIGSVLSPMHIPVLLCGFICGAPYAAVVGLIAPTLRFLLFGMPPIFPTGLAMTFELAAYGFAAGILYKALSKKSINIYTSLIGAMIIGRITWGAAMYVIAMVSEVQFGLSIFVASAFINAIPGIILHIVLIPTLVMGLERAGYTIKNLSFAQ